MTDDADTQRPSVTPIATVGVWRPIDEAPFRRSYYAGKDDPAFSVELDDWYLRARQHEHGWVIWVGSYDADEWISRDDERRCGSCLTPTHFMPLPEPPEA